MPAMKSMHTLQTRKRHRAYGKSRYAVYRGDTPKNRAKVQTEPARVTQFDCCAVLTAVPNVLFEASSKDKKGSAVVFSKAGAPLKDGVAAVDVTLDFSKIAAEEFTVHFAPSARGKYSSNCNIPLAEPIVDRWLIFEEAVQTIEAVGHQTWWEPGPAENRWIYVFGSLDGRQYKDVWEIKTDGNGKFATYKQTAENYDSRTASESFEDVAFLPALSPAGIPVHRPA